MPKCILCTSDFEVSRYAHFCLKCEERAISGIHMLVSRTEYRLNYETRSMWELPEILELAERAIMESVQRLDTLYDGDNKSLSVPPSDPVLLLMLSVTVAAEVRRLRAKVSDLSAEVQRLWELREERVSDFGLLVGQP